MVNICARHVSLEENACLIMCEKGLVKAGWARCGEEKEFVTISPTVVEVTDFKLWYNQILGVLVLIDSNDHRCIGDIQSIDVFGPYTLDNVGETRLEWKRLILLCRNHCLISLTLHRCLQ